jgi:hypothetical protein
MPRASLSEVKYGGSFVMSMSFIDTFYQIDFSEFAFPNEPSMT